jgi:hypothetical protein
VFSKFEKIDFMKQVKLFFVITPLAICFIITNSCSQTTKPGSSSIPQVFEATTPCNDVLKKLLQTPSDMECEMVKWSLTLYLDSKIVNPSTYKLNYEYGLPKQGTRGFMEGAKTIELKGKLIIEKGIKENKDAVVYKLIADNSPISLSFLKLGDNLLHLLDSDKRLMVGTGAWSYTLNNIKPVTPSSNKLFLQSTPYISVDSPIVGTFDGRTPCNDALRELNEISGNGCQIIKCRLILYQDVKTHEPTTFLLYTVYVGKGDTRYSNTGKWKMIKGTKNDPGAIVYQLDSDKPPVSLAFLKADDNILFFLDKDGNLMVGNSYCSYTLSKTKK